MHTVKEDFPSLSRKMPLKGDSRDEKQRTKRLDIFLLFDFTFIHPIDDTVLQRCNFIGLSDQ